jgi:hypothetical protein
LAIRLDARDLAAHPDLAAKVQAALESAAPGPVEAPAPEPAEPSAAPLPPRRVRRRPSPVPPRAVSAVSKVEPPATPNWSAVLGGLAVLLASVLAGVLYVVHPAHQGAPPAASVPLPYVCQVGSGVVHVKDQAACDQLLADQRQLVQTTAPAAPAAAPAAPTVPALAAPSPAAQRPAVSSAPPAPTPSATPPMASQAPQAAAPQAAAPQSTLPPCNGTVAPGNGQSCLDANGNVWSPLVPAGRPGSGTKTLPQIDPVFHRAQCWLERVPKGVAGC